MEKNKIYAALMIGALIVLGGIVMIMNNHYENQKISYNGVTLSQQDYQAIKEVFGDEYASVRVCNIKSGNCIGLFNVDEFKKLKE